MAQHDATDKKPEKTAVHDHASHPEAGSQMREDKSFNREAADDAEAAIAADDAGASAMAEKAQKDAEREARDQEQPQ